VVGLQSGLRVGDSPVLEAKVRAGRIQLLVEGAVVAGELADALFEGGVFGGDALDGFQVADFSSRAVSVLTDRSPASSMAVATAALASGLS
jgi:hypothetical protein